MTNARGDLVQQPCAYCEGTGQASGGECRACNGKGTVGVAEPAAKCSICSGKGRIGTSRCGRCYGTGWSLPRR